MVGRKRGVKSKVSSSSRSSHKGSRSSRKSAKSSSSSQLNALVSAVERLEKSQAQILANQHKQFGKINASEQQIEEDIVEAEENLPSMNEQEELTEIKRLEADLKKDTQTSPLRRITYRDVTKGLVGAFIAVVNQFAFASGFQIAEHYSIAQSTLLFITSFLIIVLFIYYTGFRKVNDKFVFRFLPMRAGILYLVSIFVSILVPFVFKTLTLDMPFAVIYGTIASISILAVLGAGTADLIGKG